ncbi:hypothetical protein BS50DRAFT_571836 [Corynespora cassiicola Philippines]|uniref:LsmAD domain-containing protein n=1 Tax=Corynespora cassiicola Philippines TaxID=1448308 RepID=A0A2T2NT67_CORCC|nr:hypothetical protein BS50DRAFT_571836 [Corynespora cassiicola Philippines]
MTTAAPAHGSNVHGPLSPNPHSTSTTPSAARAHLNMTTSAKGADGARKQTASPVDGGQRKPPQKAAWTSGNNPITQRPTNNNSPAPNGAINAPKPSHTPAAVSGETISPMRHLNDRMMFLLVNLSGLQGNITLKNGEKYTGVLSGTNLDPTEMRYVFKMVKRVQPAADSHVNGTSDAPDDYVGRGDNHVMSFDMSDVADFCVPNVVLDKAQAKNQNGFRTDTDISGHMAMRERNLQKWEPSADTNVNMSLDSQSTGWDQFSTNEQLFGVKSNYDESYYTTTINRNDPQYAEKAARAEKLAREIESSSAMNAHVREERGGQNAHDDKGEDEEEKYSGVRRDFPPLSSGQPNKYTPPARRAPTAQPTVAGAPVDPAIISSQLARPDTTPKPVATPPAEKQPTPEPPKTEAPKNDVPAAAPAKVEPPKDAATKSETKPTLPGKANVEKPSTTLKPAVAGIPARKPGRPDNATANVEHDLLDSFKQFSAAEKLRMSERQRSLARESKAVKLNDLKKFSQNFKLNTPVPQDLVPILAKDEGKQALIVEKALKAVQELKSTPPKTVATVDTKAATRSGTTAKAEPAHVSPTAGGDRQQSQPRRPAQPQQYAAATMRERPPPVSQAPPRNQHGLLSTRLQLNQQQLKQQGGVPFNAIPQPIPVQDMRVPPTGPSQTSSGVQTPTSSASTRFNVRANEFKPNPAANTFQPGHPSTNSSPRPDSSSRPEPARKPQITSFFGGQRPTLRPLDLEESFNPNKKLIKKAQEGENGPREFANNGGIQPPYRTPPTWDFPQAHVEKGYLKMFETSPNPPPISAPHNVMGNGPIPHQHQLPPHLQGPQGVPQGQTPHHTPRHHPVQPHPGQPQHFDGGHHMQFSHSTSSVHPSPRPMPPYMYGNQPPHMPGFPQQVPMQPYGMSPGVQHVALRAGQGGPQFVNPPAPGMGGQMMTSQPSNGPFMGMQPNPQMPMYSPAPAQAYLQYPGQMPAATGPNGFPSPRPGAPMMAHQGSQQGHQQQPMPYMQHGGQGPPMFAQVPPGSMTPMRGPYPQPHQPHYGSPHQHHGFPQQAHRGTPSGSYAQPMMQQHSLPPQVPPTGPANHGPEGSEEVK